MNAEVLTQLVQLVEEDGLALRGRRSVWQPDWLKWEPEKRAKTKRPKKAVPVTNNKLDEAPTRESKSAPDPTPQVEPREMLPLVSGVSPNIPQWALPFPQVRNGSDMSEAEKLDD